MLHPEPQHSVEWELAADSPRALLCAKPSLPAPSLGALGVFGAGMELAAQGGPCRAPRAVGSHWMVCFGQWSCSGARSCCQYCLKRYIPPHGYCRLGLAPCSLSCHLQQ